jgi:hypothetical protein
LLNIKCVFSFLLQNLFQSLLILIRIQRYVIVNVKTHYSCGILMNLEIFSTDCRKKSQIPSFMKIRPLGAELFHADGLTDVNTLMFFVVLRTKNVNLKHKRFGRRIPTAASGESFQEQLLIWPSYCWTMHKLQKVSVA